MNRSLFTRLAALALAASLSILLGACNLFEEDEGAGDASLWIGKPIDSLTAVGGIELRGDRLFVVNASDSVPGVAAIDTATGLVAEYYETTLPPAGMAFTSEGHLVVTATDYVNGSVSVIDPAARKIRKDVIPFGSDPGITAVDGKVYLIDHTTGAITGFTGNTPGQNVTLDVQAGAGSNPYGIAISGGKAYIPRYNKASLLILNDAGAIGGGTRDSIDLSAYVSKTPLDTPATAPRMAAVTAHNGYVFVTLQRLNYKYAAKDTSIVVVINAATKAIEKTIPLTFRNPGSARVRDGVWYISGVQGYGLNDGGVEKIDLSARAHAGTVVTEATLGGDVSTFLPTGASTGYAVFSPGWPVYRIKKVAP
jgi:DNA-binding beta-propeller fold protein YncE